MNKELKRKILKTIIPPIGYLLIRLIFLSCKKRYKITSNVPKTPFIMAFWHGNLLMQPFVYEKLREKSKIAVMISDHFDGEIISNIISFFGLKSIRGSSSKGAIKALKESFKKIDDGYDLAITPDGPRGPRKSVADGIIAIAQKKKLPIIASSYQASSFWQLKSWDKFIIPKPFSTITLTSSEPFSLEGLDKQEAKKILKEII